jgi:NCS1 family nucleobase:cation symporter-1
MSSHRSIHNALLPIEDRTLSPVPGAERHGRIRDLFTFWFGPNITLLAVVNGALATAVYGQPFWLGALGLVLGNLAGAVVLALHSVQGARLGVPQLVQTRAQFGSYGAVLVIACVAVFSVGFGSVNLALAGQSLNALSGHFSVEGTIVVVAAASALLVVFGCDFMHSAARAMSWVGGAMLLLAFAWILGSGHLAAGFWQSGRATVAGFAETVSVAALWQISYAPYVADYSRYLPASTSARRAFWSSYAGTSAGSIAAMLLGAIIGVQTSDVVGGLLGLVHDGRFVVIGVFTACLALASAINIYGASMSVITIGQAFLPRGARGLTRNLKRKLPRQLSCWLTRKAIRPALAVIIAALATAGAIMSRTGFLVDFADITELLMYVLVPWTAINLVDYYLIKAGKYRVAEFLRADGGRYGRINWVAAGCFLGGVALELPFVRTPAFTGPAADALGGADISWLVCLAVVGPLYYLLAPLARPRSSAMAAEEKIVAATAS